MTERENTPGSPCPPLKFSQHDLELDKSADGRYWRLLHWTNDGVLLQLRIVHSTVDDPNDFIAKSCTSGRWRGACQNHNHCAARTCAAHIVRCGDPQKRSVRP